MSDHYPNRSVDDLRDVERLLKLVSARIVLEPDETTVITGLLLKIDDSIVAKHLGSTVVPLARGARLERKYT